MYDLPMHALFRWHFGAVGEHSGGRGGGTGAYARFWQSCACDLKHLQPWHGAADPSGLRPDRRCSGGLLQSAGAFQTNHADVYTSKM